MAAQFPVDDMDSHNQRTINEFHFEETVAGLARFNPAALAVLVRRRLSAMATRGASAKYWAAVRAREFLLLAKPEFSEALETHRTTTVAATPHEDQIANSWLLQVSAVHSPVEEQLPHRDDGSPTLIPAAFTPAAWANSATSADIVLSARALRKASTRR